jgi:acylphosphatase
MDRRLHIIVGGRVQGVWFRASTRQAARQLGLTGRVWNRADGRVEIIAERENQALERLLEGAAEGPERARVDELEKSWAAASGEFSDFEIS